MRSLRRIAVVLLIVIAFALPGSGCGPFFPEAVLVLQTRPDGAYAAYVKGRIGVPQARYRVRHLVVAYDWLNGAGLSAGEQQQALALDGVLSPGWGEAAPQVEAGPGLLAWVGARQAAGVPGAPEAVGAKPNQPWTAKTALQSVETDRRVPGDEYESFPNCLDDAFATAARTLQARKVAHANDAASVGDWVRGQDAVFANCGDGAATMPAVVPATAPAWLRQDRAYQMAAASFYQMDFDGAITLLREVAGDAGSPWHGTARLVMARAMIRRAMLGQITEVPAGAVAPPNAPYDEKRAEAMGSYNRVLLEKRPARLAEARDALRGIVADPKMGDLHGAASGLLDFVMLRLNPQEQGQTLATRLTARDRSQTPGVFRQALIDVAYVMDQPVSPGSGPAQAPHTDARAADLIGWMRVMGADQGRRERGYGNGGDASGRPAERREASREALAEWRREHSAPWLVAALITAKPGDAGAGELAHAAAEVARSSPAWAAATYGRLRLSADARAERTELDAVLPEVMREQSRSTTNLFTILRQRGSPTLGAFLEDAGTLPAAFTSMDDDPEAPQTTPNPNNLCGEHSSEAETRLFDHDAATVLNTRMPLRLLAEAAEGQSLAKNLRYQVVQATWARAVLLGRPETAMRLSPLLTGCYPAWRPWLERYDGAADAEERQVSGLLALMRFASTEPIVRDGEQRLEGFATYSEFRDNWWVESKAGGSPANADGTGNATAPEPPTFFGARPATREEMPDPPFLAEADRAEAEREIAALRKIPCASDYFAQSALEWQKAHPADPRTPDVLGFAERVVRNGCRTEATKELNHRLFTVVQTRYPKSEWAAKYTTWE